MVQDRVEKDFLGYVRIPVDALWGKRTQRFHDNYQLSGMRYPGIFIGMIAQVKKAAALANASAGLIPKEKADAIVKAAERIIGGEYSDQFIVDTYAPHTAFNMNANEVIAAVAGNIMDPENASKSPVHPNDDVNKGQSTLDVVPTVVNLVCIYAGNYLVFKIEALRKALIGKADEFSSILKVGRTHMMDGPPIMLGQVFRKYASWIQGDKERIKNALVKLHRVAIGTLVGTAVEGEPEYRKGVLEHLSDDLGMQLEGYDEGADADDTSDYLELSSSLRSLSLDLKRMISDLRFMNSGPNAGVGEIEMPPTEPGSSFFPGKVNPGISGSVMGAAAHAIGNDEAVTTMCQMGEQEANVFVGLIGLELYDSMTILTEACDHFTEKAITGLKANREKIKELTERSMGVAVLLTPYVGYDKATEFARIMRDRGKNLKDVVRESGVDGSQKILDLLEKLGY